MLDRLRQYDISFNIGGYRIDFQAISFKDIFKFFAVGISGKEPEDFKNIEKKLKKEQNWGGKDNINKQMDKVIDREL
ncbi:MAG: hypothetical protein ACOCQA_03135 [bacterium]